MFEVKVPEADYTRVMAAWNAYLEAVEDVLMRNGYTQITPGRAEHPEFLVFIKAEKTNEAPAIGCSG